MNAPFRYDIVGSFLRPERLKEARKQFEDQAIDFDTLTKIEDECITELIQKQISEGLQVITDGEFRRESWHLDFMWGFNGIAHQKTNTGIPFNGEVALIDDTYLVDKISVDNHPFVDHFKFVKQFETEAVVARQTIPAPAQFLFQMVMPSNQARTSEVYSNNEDLINDIVVAYKKVINDLYEAGCRNVQLDDCTWGVFVDENACVIMNTDEQGIKQLIKDFVRINNLVIEGKPADLVITSHICRGNFHSTWACSGGYEKVASELFANENVDAFYLEFDDERSGNFEPLRYINNQKVVLGLITSKSPELEDKEAIINRIKEASKYVALDNLYLSPQCGFASTLEGNKLTDEDQWLKMKLVKEIAMEVWK